MHVQWKDIHIQESNPYPNLWSSTLCPRYFNIDTQLINISSKNIFSSILDDLRNFEMIKNYESFKISVRSIIHTLILLCAKNTQNLNPYNILFPKSYSICQHLYLYCLSWMQEEKLSIYGHDSIICLSLLKFLYTCNKSQIYNL